MFLHSILRCALILFPPSSPIAFPGLLTQSVCHIVSVCRRLGVAPHTTGDTETARIHEQKNSKVWN